MVLEKHHARRYTDNVNTYECEDNMAASSVTIRVDSEIKEGASHIAEHFGFDLSSVTRAFYMQNPLLQKVGLSKTSLYSELLSLS